MFFYQSETALTHEVDSVARFLSLRLPRTVLMIPGVARAATGMVPAQDHIRLAPLLTDDAGELSFRRLGTSNGYFDEAAFQLVLESDRLPIAIMQATVYITEKITTITNYLERFVQFTGTVKPDGSIRIHRLFHHCIQKWLERTCGSPI